MAFNIEFDYRFDSTGFFDENTHADRRAALEKAAKIWEGLIGDEFVDVRAGTTFSIDDPSADGTSRQITLANPIDDLLIFVGAESLSGALGIGGFDGVDAEGDVFSQRISGNFRGQTVTDFEPWAGTISFEKNADWSFSLDGAVAGMNDFLTIALHEIGHVLGFGTAKAFNALVSPDGMFTGVNAQAENGGAPVPLQPDVSHVEDGFDGGTVLMDPTATTGTRTEPSNLDLAMLADIGYQTDGFTAKGSTPPIATDGGETIFGTILADRIEGLGGNDQLQGSGGDDTLVGGAGDDQIFGEGGSDRFVIGPGDGADQIRKFDIATEVVELVDSGFATLAEVMGAITRDYTNGWGLNLADGTKVEIFPAAMGPLTEANFALVSSTPEPPAPGQVALTGRLTTPDGTPLADVPLVFALDGGGSTQATSDATGAFGFTLADGASGRLDLAGPPPATDGIDASDALAALKLAVGLTDGADGFDFIAADADRNGKVTSFDALEILKQAVGLDATGPGELVLPDPAQDLSGLGADNVVYDSVLDLTLTADTSLDLSAVILGEMIA